jgi:hypothetical protein
MGYSILRRAIAVRHSICFPYLVDPMLMLVEWLEIRLNNSKFFYLLFPPDSKLIDLGGPSIATEKQRYVWVNVWFINAGKNGWLNYNLRMYLQKFLPYYDWYYTKRIIIINLQFEKMVQMKM